jgi:hypothetical protein
MKSFKLLMVLVFGLTLTSTTIAFADPVITSQFYPASAFISGFQVCFDGNPNWCFGPSPKHDNRGRAYLEWDLGPYEDIIGAGDHTVTVEACHTWYCSPASVPMQFSLPYVATPVIGFK